MTPGWFRVYREDLKWMDLTERDAWVWLQSLARFRNGDGLRKGQFIMSRQALATRQGWHESKARRVLARLVRDGLIRPTTNRPPNRSDKASVFAVCARQADHPTDHQPTTIEERKKVEERTNGEAGKDRPKTLPSEGGAFN